MNVVSKPDRVQAYRVESELHRTLQAVRSGYPVTRPATPTSDVVESGLPQGLHVLVGPVPVDMSTAAELSQILHDPKTYAFESAKACTFNPDLAVRFDQGNRSVVVVFCFTCDELAIYDGATGQHVGTEDDDSRREQLLAIAKRLFPEDPCIQGLVSNQR